ncbi:MAG: peptide chain release factor N(5)-glutamine methyltransferase [Sphaerochaetaceae bacterium]
MNIEQALKEGAHILYTACVTDTPFLEASLLLCSVLDLQKEELYRHDSIELENAQHERYLQLVQKRAAYHPIAYLIGKQEFWGLPFIVNENVLIPRNDTETLVEQALSMLDEETEYRVLDLATGSGCVGIAVATERPLAHVLLSDLSAKALTIALANSKELLGKELPTIQSDLFRSLQNLRFHMIMSNPPYLSSQWIDQCEKQVKKEPIMALDGMGDDGLSLIRHIISESPHYLENGGILLLECDYRQHQEISDLLLARGFSQIGGKRDLQGLLRVVWGVWHV